MTAFAFWFDSIKELNYPFICTRVIRGGRFFKNDFTTRVNSYIGTTNVVADVLRLLDCGFIPLDLVAHITIKECTLMGMSVQMLFCIEMSFYSTIIGV